MTCVDFRWAEFILDELIHLRKFTLPLFCVHCAIKAKTGYVSENDDPTRPKSDYTPPTEDDLVNVE
ncbi:hypothetical protein KY285_028629 [Solanum tuberosum]|nr:hypothetical protein KY284_029401 [Solanum tuberosum]KAH0667423.1 hypothetical protein KY285_028629 [Solanum tuberosum]